tara:strand:- start:78 stop:1103 length:1026 start_codon:yes stop_codon:yes gene_type:complete
MHVVQSRNANKMYPEALRSLRTYGRTAQSRNGPVTKFPGPCTFLFRNPTERVVFWQKRDANPFFHLLEALWMLAGRNDVAYPASIVSTMTNFSDDGETYNGAYGYRWRRHFGYDQIARVIENLRLNPECRRQVISMWDGHHDLGLASKDIPCNLQALFSVNEDGELDMTVTNRSNDLVWGALGANVVHFSILQEFIARALGRAVGQYWQVSNNMHLYTEKHTELLTALEPMEANPLTGFETPDPYSSGTVQPFPLMTVDYRTWLQDLEMWQREGVVLGLRDPFFRTVAHPMAMAHKAWKENKGQRRYDVALEILERVQATDWRLAGREWIRRREMKFQEKN